MYNVSSSPSLFPTQIDEIIWEVNVGELLRGVAGLDVNAPAMVEIDPSGIAARRWTYGELLDQSEALTLGARFAPGDQCLATLFDGFTRHSPEGIAFNGPVEAMRRRQAVRERDDGTYDWTKNRPINAPIQGIAHTQSVFPDQETQRHER